jgi:hypothetical protein
MFTCLYINDSCVRISTCNYDGIRIIDEMARIPSFNLIKWVMEVEVNSCSYVGSTVRGFNWMRSTSSDLVLWTIWMSIWKKIHRVDDLFSIALIKSIQKLVRWACYFFIDNLNYWMTDSNNWNDYEEQENRHASYSLIDLRFTTNRLAGDTTRYHMLNTDDCSGDVVGSNVGVRNVHKNIQIHHWIDPQWFQYKQHK